ncbi:MAG TPA: glycoside hydrolase family 3 protein [Longimicrobiales bacterium]|nr:glycoside hydrolase family 3 protein [Longimicrobiales bacterium]
MLRAAMLTFVSLLAAPPGGAAAEARAPVPEPPAARAPVCEDAAAPARWARPDSMTMLWVERALAELTVREKVAQLVMPWITGGIPERGSPEWHRSRRMVLEQGVGGFIVGKGDAYGTAAWLNELQTISPLPLLVGADLEWGAGTRIAEATTLPVNMALAAGGGAELAYRAGVVTAREARAVGIHMAFAPVADVNVNPANPVINTRSYGAEAGAVAMRVGAFIDGAREGGMLSVAKHFPGHGDTDLDSHVALPRLDLTRARLDSVELVPFRVAIARGVDAIMTAHVQVPALSPGVVLPATLEPAILTGLLRGEMGYDGLIVTDALNMDGVAKGRTSGEIALAAVLAGADILLQPANTGGVVDALEAAVLRGLIPEARIDASVRRILAAKAAMGLHERRRVDLCEVLSAMRTVEHQALATELAERSMTLLTAAGAATTLPVAMPRGAAGDDVVVILYDDGRGRGLGEIFLSGLRGRGVSVDTVRLHRRSSAAEVRRAEARAGRGARVVFATFARAVAGKGRLGLPTEVAAMADRLASRGAVVISFGDPYVARQLPRARDYLLAWSDADVSQVAAVRALMGEIVVTGTLPIQIPPRFLVGDGLRVDPFIGILGETWVGPGPVLEPRELREELR